MRREDSFKKIKVIEKIREAKPQKEEARRNAKISKKGRK